MLETMLETNEKFVDKLDSAKYVDCLAKQDECILPATNGLQECTTLEKLSEYELQKLSKSHRESHVNERNTVFLTFSKIRRMQNVFWIVRAMSAGWADTRF